MMPQSEVNFFYVQMVTQNENQHPGTMYVILWINRIYLIKVISYIIPLIITLKAHGPHVMINTCCVEFLLITF